MPPKLEQDNQHDLLNSPHDIDPELIESDRSLEANFATELQRSGLSLESQSGDCVEGFPDKRTQDGSSCASVSSSSWSSSHGSPSTSSLVLRIRQNVDKPESASGHLFDALTPEVTSPLRVSYPDSLPPLPQNFEDMIAQSDTSLNFEAGEKDILVNDASAHAKSCGIYSESAPRRYTDEKMFTLDFPSATCKEITLASTFILDDEPGDSERLAMASHDVMTSNGPELLSWSSSHGIPSTSASVHRQNVDKLESASEYLFDALAPENTSPNVSYPDSLSSFAEDMIAQSDIGLNFEAEEKDLLVDDASAHAKLNSKEISFASTSLLDDDPSDSEGLGMESYGTFTSYGPEFAPLASESGRRPSLDLSANYALLSAEEPLKTYTNCSFGPDLVCYVQRCDFE